MSGGTSDPRMTTIHPRIRYNTIGGVNGPLVILENVRSSRIRTGGSEADTIFCRSNSQGSMKSCPSHFQMAPRDRDRCWKHEVGLLCFGPMLVTFLIQMFLGNRAVVQVQTDRL